MHAVSSGTHGNNHHPPPDGRICVLMPLHLSCSELVGTLPVQETSIARRGLRGRTHFAGTRRTFPGTSQGVRRGPATMLGEVN